MKPRLIGNLVLMCALGAGMFAVMIGLRQMRIGRPLAAGRQDIDTAGGNSAESVTNGIQISLLAAETDLANQRQAGAVRALDAAMRAAGVARDAFESAGGIWAFDVAYQTILKARIAIQNHNDMHAARLIESALDALPAGPPGTAPLPADLGRYAGAGVINAEGVRVGKLRRVDGRSAVLDVGGRYNLLGFFDLSGTPVRVSTARLLFGKRRTLGNTYVVLQAASAAANEPGAGSWSAHR